MTEAPDTETPADMERAPITRIDMSQGLEVVCNEIEAVLNEPANEPNGLTND